MLQLVLCPAQRAETACGSTCLPMSVFRSESQKQRRYCTSHMHTRTHTHTRARAHTHTHTRDAYSHLVAHRRLAFKPQHAIMDRFAAALTAAVILPRAAGKAEPRPPKAVVQLVLPTSAGEVSAKRQASVPIDSKEEPPAGMRVRQARNVKRGKARASRREGHPAAAHAGSMGAVRLRPG
jgi:hypothetical protein